MRLRVSGGPWGGGRQAGPFPGGSVIVFGVFFDRRTRHSASLAGSVSLRVTRLAVGSGLGARGGAAWFTSPALSGGR